LVIGLYVVSAQANAVIAHEGWQDRKVQKPFRVEYETHNGEYVK